MDDFLAQLPAIAGIFGLAFFYFWSAIPAGLALGLSPGVIITVTTLSYVAGVAIVLLPGERIRAWVMRRWGRKSADEQSNGRMQRIWEKYGIVGLGLLAPMTLGAQLGAILGITLNADPRRLFLWLSLGGLVWSVALTVLVSLGVLGAQAVM